MSEIGVHELDEKGPGHASDHDLERGLEPTGASGKDDNVSVANSTPDSNSRVPMTAKDRPPKMSSDRNHGQTTD